jgi:solute carrier family 66 (lysosomal lysine-arginine transporter), member 1
VHLGIHVEYIPLTTRKVFSSISGSVSLACWIFLLVLSVHSQLHALADLHAQVPQLVENYRNGSAEAISLGFIFIWFLGDICNLIGAAWGDRNRDRSQN